MSQKVSNKIAQKEDVLVYSAKTKHLFSKEEMKLFELAEQGKLHSVKFWKIKTEWAIKETRKQFNENPGQSTKSIIVKILEALPEEMPTDKLLHFVSLTINEWRKLHQTETIT